MKQISILFILIVFGSIFIFSCQDSSSENSDNPDQSIDSVTLADLGTHFDLTMDYTKGVTPREMGKQLGEEIIQAFAGKSRSYQEIVDSYINDVLTNQAGSSASYVYTVLMTKSAAFINYIQEDYYNEIDGLAVSVCDSTTDSMGDGKLSKNELYFLELIIDIGKTSQCSAISVFDNFSATRSTITGRVLDFKDGNSNQLAQLHAVTRIKKDNNKSIILVGFIGHLSGITVVNESNVFAAILESETGETLPSVIDSSYAMDLRYAMENYTTIDNVSNYMINKNYASGHLVFLSDPTESKVLENCLDHVRAVRTSSSALNSGITWNNPNAIGCVNSFILENNFDNHILNGYNTARWSSIVSELMGKGSVVTKEEMKALVTYFSGSEPSLMIDGDLYNRGTKQIILAEPALNTIEIFFRPKNTGLPTDPVFETIDIDF